MGERGYTGVTVGYCRIPKISRKGESDIYIEEEDDLSFM